jgi:hypothetical protein
MNTHVVYRAKGKRYKQYFAGRYTGERDKEGYYIVEFRWSECIENATPLLTTDAWDLLAMCRKAWPHLTLHVGRIVKTEDVLIGV